MTLPASSAWKSCGSRLNGINKFVAAFAASPALHIDSYIMLHQTGLAASETYIPARTIFPCPGRMGLLLYWGGEHIPSTVPCSWFPDSTLCLIWGRALPLAPPSGRGNPFFFWQSASGGALVVVAGSVVAPWWRFLFLFLFWRVCVCLYVCMTIM